MAVYPAFCAGFSTAQGFTTDEERLVNWYPEIIQGTGATSDASLYPTPGVTSIGTPNLNATPTPSIANGGIPTGAGRGHFFRGGVDSVGFGTEFYVIGTFLYAVNSAGVFTPLHDIGNDDLPVTFASNGDAGGQILVTSAGRAWLYSFSGGSAGLTQEIAALALKATMCTGLDGYFLVLDAATSTVYISDLLDGTTFSTGTKFFQRSLAQDPWKAMQVMGRYIYLVGEQTSEIWYDTGAFPVPFEPHPSGYIPYGICAPYSLRLESSSLCWLGTDSDGDRYVIRVTGFNAEKISTFPLENQFRSYATISDAVGDSYSDLGHQFYIISFPTQGVSWAYDAQTGQWHERGTWITEADSFTVWRPRWHAMAYGEHRMLDSSTPVLYRMASTIYTDADGRVIRRVRRAPILVANKVQGESNQRIYYSAFELDMEVGLGNTVDPDSDPQIALRMSNDGGKTWGTEIWRSAGKIGEYQKRVRWNRGGMARKRAVEVSTTSTTPVRITNFYVELGQPIKGAPSA